jgi:hypothetical protein
MFAAIQSVFLMPQTFALELNDAEAALLRRVAQRFATTPEQFARATVVDALTRQSHDPEFVQAALRVLEKNYALLKRLAQ